MALYFFIELKKNMYYTIIVNHEEATKGLCQSLLKHYSDSVLCYLLKNSPGYKTSNEYNAI